MTPEAQRIAIAEACGLTVCTHGPEKWEHEGPEGDRDLVCTICRKDIRDLRLPEYPTDLNAMHEAEKALTEDQCFHYRYEIQKAVLKTTAHCSSDFVFGATAAQRAEAFLKTVGKWAGL